MSTFYRGFSYLVLLALFIGGAFYGLSYAFTTKDGLLAFLYLVAAMIAASFALFLIGVIGEAMEMLDNRDDYRRKKVSE